MRQKPEIIAFYTELSSFCYRFMITSQSSPPSAGSYNLNLQAYTLHPFIDVYVTKCDKGMAFDYVTSKISNIKGKEKGPQKIMYLGDSDNDNPAFTKADVSIGVRSDDGLNPKLSYTKILKYEMLPIFLKSLMENNFL
jgi:hypothetical protein